MAVTSPVGSEDESPLSFVCGRRSTAATSPRFSTSASRTPSTSARLLGVAADTTPVSWTTSSLATRFGRGAPPRPSPTATPRRGLPRGQPAHASDVGARPSAPGSPARDLTDARRGLGLRRPGSGQPGNRRGRHPVSGRGRPRLRATPRLQNPAAESRSPESESRARPARSRPDRSRSRREAGG